MGKNSQSTRRVRHHGTNILSDFQSLKNGSTVYCESTIEKDFCFLLEFNPWVDSYTTQPFALTAAFTNGKYHTYTPDFLVRGVSGNLIVECKPAERVPSPHVQRQVTIGQAWAEENEHEFVLVTDQQLRAGYTLHNLKLLYRYRQQDVPPSILKCVYAALDDQPDGVCLNALVATLDAACTLKPGYAIRAVLYALLFRHVLIADLTVPITNDSRICLPTDTQQEVVHGAHGLQ